MPQSPGGYQGFHPADDWPRLELASFSRVINYDARTMREEQVRRQGSYPARGGGGIPIEGEQRLVNLVNGTYAWAVQGTNVNPQPTAAQTACWASLAHEFGSHGCAAVGSYAD